MGGFQVRVMVLDVGLWVSTSTGGSGASGTRDEFRVNSKTKFLDFQKDYKYLILRTIITKMLQPEF